MTVEKKPSLLVSLLPIVFLLVMLVVNIAVFGDDAISGSNQMVLLLSGAFAAVVAIFAGSNWQKLLDGIMESIHSSMSAIMILLMIGALAGTWLISGILPAMIFYGLKILNPTIFLFAACVVCAIVSLATGSSWSTVATIGIALLGIGKALGFSDGIIAGAIISGAYFGDKISPLSDTTNLAPAMAGTDLFTHIRYMLYTTVPTLILTLIIFLIFGLNFEGQTDTNQVNGLLSSITETFNITPLLFLVPVIVIVLIVKKMPALPALFIGTLLGGVAAMIFQPDIIVTLSGVDGNFLHSSYITIMNAMSRETAIVTSNETLNALLSTKGMAGMMNTIWLIICAMTFGGIMEHSGMLGVISGAVVKMAKTTGSLIATTTGTCIFFNVTASDQYLAIVVPGRMYADVYRERGLAPQNLSRTLEDAGTVTSVLVPWNTCGATQASVLGVATGTYLPYCFFNIISPLMTMFFGYMNIKIAKLDKGQ